MTGHAESLGRRLGQWASDARGQMTVEWALVLAAVALPMYFILRMLTGVLVAHFQMVTLLETLPFP